MLKLNCVVSLTLSLIFISNVISKIRAEGSEALQDVSDPGTSWDSNKIPDAPPASAQHQEEPGHIHDENQHEGELVDPEGHEAVGHYEEAAAQREAQAARQGEPAAPNQEPAAHPEGHDGAGTNTPFTKRMPYRTMAPTTLTPLTFEEEQEHITPLIRRGWIKDKTRNIIRKDFYFKSFFGAFSFMTQIALMAEKISHFPDWFNNNNKVKVSLSSKQIRAISMKDIVLAKYADRVYPAQKFL